MRLLGRPVVLGERDWSLICDWQERGIPLSLIAEAIDHLQGKLARRHSKPRNLAALAPLVEESWRVVREARVAEKAEPSGAVLQDDPVASWRRCATALPPGDPLRVRIEQLLGELEAGTVPEACDAALDAELGALLPTALQRELAATVEGNLAGFRSRMTPDTWRATRRRALVSAARRRLGLRSLILP